MIRSQVCKQLELTLNSFEYIGETSIPLTGVRGGLCWPPSAAPRATRVIAIHLPLFPVAYLLSHWAVYHLTLV